MSEDLNIFNRLKDKGADLDHLGDSKAYRIASDIGSGIISAPSDAGASGLNTVADMGEYLGVQRAIYRMVHGDEVGYEPYRFSGRSDIEAIDREVSGLEEGTSEFTGLVGATIISGGTNLGLGILNWGSKGNIGRKVFAEALTALPADVILSDDSGEHLMFDDNKEESAIARRSKNIMENAGMGMLGDYALRGLSATYKAWRKSGKTADDATQAVFNKEVPEGQADEINKIRPTAELQGDEALDKAYKENPMYKMDNREATDTLPKDTIKQMDNVTKAEKTHRDGVQSNYERASKESAVPFESVPEGYTSKDIEMDSKYILQGKQRREEFLNLFDTVASGKVIDEKTTELFWKFTRRFNDEAVDPDIDALMKGATGKEREALMRRVREKFKNNPMLMDERDFVDKTKITGMLSDKLGLGVKKKYRSMYDVWESFQKLSVMDAKDKNFKLGLRSLAKNTSMDEESLLYNMAELNIVTDRFSEYAMALTKLVDTHAGAMVDAQKVLSKELKATGKLDFGSKAFKKWLTALGASTEVHEGVSKIKGNFGRALRSSGENMGAGIKSFTKEFDDKYAKGMNPSDSADSASSQYMRAKQLMEKHNEARAKLSANDSTMSLTDIARDADATTNELIKMIRGTSTIDGAKALVSGVAKDQRRGLADMFIAMGISNLLAGPQTIGKIALSTAQFVLYKQTLLPFYSGLINRLTKGDTGERAIADTVASWMGMMDVAKVYATVSPKDIWKSLRHNKTPEQIAEMSRGFRGMQIEGQGFNELRLKELWHLGDETGWLGKYGGRLMTAPLWFGNTVMTKGIVPVDDFFRRSMLEAEARKSIRQLYTRGINVEDSLERQMASGFDNYKDYEKSMLPLFTDVKNTLFKHKDSSDKEIREAMNSVFNKYRVTRMDNDAQTTIMAEVLRGEKRAAEAVSQETTDDMVLGRAVKGFLNGIESTGPLGKIASATLVPFQTAPLNIMRSAMEETPGLNFLSKRWWNKFNTGVTKGKRAKWSKERNEAVAQVMAGTTVGLGAWAIVNSFDVYGHIPVEEMKGAQEMGIQPYSIVIDGKAYSYDFLGTFKAPMAMMADYKKYGMEGNNTNAYMQALKTFALTAGNNPYFDSMQDMTNLLQSDVETKDIARFFTAKSTQFLQVGSSMNRAIKAYKGGEVEISALSEYYDNVWLRELDMRNKDNPAYRFFRDFTNPNAYTQKTDLFGEGLTRNGEGASSYLPYITMGMSNTPATTSPGIVLLRELDLVNQDFTKLGDVEISNARAQEFKEKLFSDSGLGLGRLLNQYATNDEFMSASDGYRKNVIATLLNNHKAQVESNMGLDIVEKQYKLDELMRQLDYDSTGAKMERSATSRQMGEYIHKLERRKARRGTIEREGVRDILESK